MEETTEYCSAKTLEYLIRLTLHKETIELGSRKHAKNKTIDDIEHDFISTGCIKSQMTKRDTERFQKFANHDKTISAKINRALESFDKFMKSKALF